MMYRKIIIISFAIIIASCQEKYSPEIKEYVDFLKNNDIKSAKEYIFELWETYDIVMICERDHGDVTQYDLILDIVKDKRFIDQIGHIFTETGTVLLQDSINKFVQTVFETDSVRNKIAADLYFNLNWFPFWGYNSYYNLMITLNELNTTLSEKDKINLYSSDIPFPGWKSFNSDKAYEKWRRNVLYSDRDSIMAQNIIKKIDQIENSTINRIKCLVIMNARHAYNRDIEYTYWENDVTNTGRYLFNYYEGT